MIIRNDYYIWLLYEWSGSEGAILFLEVMCIYSCPATKWKVRIGGCLSFVVKVKIRRNEPFQMNINKK